MLDRSYVEHCLVYTPTPSPNMSTFPHCAPNVDHSSSTLLLDLLNTSINPIDTINSAASTSVSIHYETSATDDGILSSSPWFVEMLEMCYWVLLVTGGVCNLLVLTIAVYRRSRKQVSTKGMI